MSSYWNSLFGIATVLNEPWRSHRRLTVFDTPVCPDGTERDEYNSDIHSCRDCDIGYYSNVETKHQCKFCAYSFYPGAANCDLGELF